MDKRNDSGGVRETMTDSEMWMELHYGLKAAGADALDGGGLCRMLYRYSYACVIGIDQLNRMRWQLKDAFGLQVDAIGYYWPQGRAVPRIKACLKLAKLTEGK